MQKLITKPLLSLIKDVLNDSLFLEFILSLPRRILTETNIHKLPTSEDVLEAKIYCKLKEYFKNKDVILNVHVETVEKDYIKLYIFIGDKILEVLKIFNKIKVKVYRVAKVITI